MAWESKNKTSQADRKKEMRLTINTKPKKYIPKKKIVLTDKLDELAKLYNKTKEKKYYEEWFKLVKKFTKKISC